MTYRLLIEGINPEPWTTGTATIGRSKGKLFARIAKNPALVAYQRAIQDELHARYPDLVPLDGPVRLHIWLWRQRAGRTRHADLTNLQKALEDALQADPRNDWAGVYRNDRQVAVCTTHVVDQAPATEPLILVRAEPLQDHEARIHASYARSLADTERHDHPLPAADHVPPQRPDVEDIF